MLAAWLLERGLSDQRAVSSMVGSTAAAPERDAVARAAARAGLLEEQGRRISPETMAEIEGL